jgi:hypothetical protein
LSCLTFVKGIHVRPRPGRASGDRRLLKTELEEMFFHFAPSAQEAIDRALEMKGRHASILGLPYAVDCVPQVSSAG